MHKQKGWLRWVPPQCPALIFSCLPQMEAWHRSGPPPTAASVTPRTVTYRWSHRAVYPFSSSSSFPKQADEKQGISSMNSQEVGIWAHLEGEGWERRSSCLPTLSVPEWYPRCRATLLGRRGRVSSAERRPLHTCAWPLSPSLQAGQAQGQGQARKQLESGPLRAKGCCDSQRCLGSYLPPFPTQTSCTKVKYPYSVLRQGQRQVSQSCRF